MGENRETEAGKVAHEGGRGTDLIPSCPSTLLLSLRVNLVASATRLPVGGGEQKGTRSPVGGWGRSSCWWRSQRSVLRPTRAGSDCSHGVPPRQMGPGLFVPSPQPRQGQMSPRGRGQGLWGRSRTSTPLTVGGPKGVQGRWSSWEGAGQPPGIWINSGV